MREAVASDLGMDQKGITDEFPLPEEFSPYDMITLYEETRLRWCQNVFLGAHVVASQPDRSRRELKAARRIAWSCSDALWVGEQWGSRARRVTGGADKQVFVRPLLPKPLKPLLVHGKWEAVAEIVPASIGAAAEVLDVLEWRDQQFIICRRTLAYAIQYGLRARIAKRAGLVFEGCRLELGAFRAPLDGGRGTSGERWGGSI